MSLRRAIAIAVLSAGCLIGSLGQLNPASAEQTVDCWVNGNKQTCTITPWGKDGMEIVFSGGALFRFAPAGPATTDKRRMRDEQGRLWLMSGNRSFELVEQGGFGPASVQKWLGWACRAKPSTGWPAPPTVRGAGAASAIQVRAAGCSGYRGSH